MLKNVEPARFTRADANLDVLDRLLQRRFAGKARRGEAKALPPNSAEVRGLDIKLAEASGTWERRFSYVAANGRGHFMLAQTVPTQKTRTYG